jgi:phenylacetate-CoA ligase
MSKIMGRTDDMIFVRGVSLFPSQIESVLLRRPEVEPRYMIEVERKDALDHLTVSAEISSDFFDAKKENIGELERFIEGELLDFLGVQAKVKLLPHGSLPLKDSKTAMVVDKRKI